MKTTSIDTLLIGIGTILTNNHLRVPSYQRSYAWEDDDINDLFDDIGKAIDKREPEYFLGSAVLSESGDELEIIDGQQRIATLSIILAAIRNWLKQSGDAKSIERAGIIEQEYLFKKDLQTLELRPKLQLNLVDHPYFLGKVLRNESAVEAETDSHRRLSDAVTIATRRVKELAESDFEESTKTLTKWIEYLNDNAKIIRVTVPDHANAFTIFETLNDRGRDLAISDLIKNFLFSQARGKIMSAQASWMQMASSLEGLNERNIQVDFIRHAWSARNGLTRERELFKEFKERVESADDACAVTKQLEISAKKYSAIVSCSASEWGGYGQGFVNCLSAIRTMGVENVRPLLLAVVEMFGKEKAKKAMMVIKNCVTRATVVGGQRGTYEKHYSSIASEVYKKSVTQVDELASKLRLIAPTDEVFIEAFENLSISKAKLARFFLRELEKTANPSTSGWDPVNDETEVNLEHILPKRKGNEWEGFDDESHKTYRNRLGNQCLLNATTNSSIGNSCFSDKHAALSSSDYVTTKWAAESESWSGGLIKARQQRLAKLAPTTWPL